MIQSSHGVVVGPANKLRPMESAVSTAQVKEVPSGSFCAKSAMVWMLAGVLAGFLLAFSIVV